MAQHTDNCGHMIVVIVTFFIFIITIIIAIFSAFGGTVLFPVDTMGSYYAFHVSFDVAPWMHFIWFPIAIWSASWIIYGMTTVRRRDKISGVALYCSPGCIHVGTYSMFSVALLCALGNLATLSHAYLGMALGFSILQAIALFFCLLFSTTNLAKYTPELIQTGRSKEIPIIKGMLINAIGLYSGWADYQVFAMMGKLLVYYAVIDHTTAGGIVLSLWTLLYVAAFILDQRKWDRMTRHLMTPYITGLVISISMFTHYIVWTEMVAMDYIILMTVATHFILFMGKIWVAVRKDKRDRRENANYNALVLTMLGLP